MKESATLFLKGLAMGAANVIPGVSGGTIALITGIYETLINSLKEIDLEAIKLFFQGKFRDFWTKINGGFLTAIFLGIVVSIISIAVLFKFLLEDPVYAIWLMAFFFGLILLSVYSVGKTVSQWSTTNIIALILGLVIAVVIALLNPANENDAYFYLFICGIIAMCSMILPGLSGSFVLLLMGNYKLVMLDSVNALRELKLEEALPVIIPVGVGAVVGMVAFSRILSWVFKTYRDLTIALLTGFILGSLTIIWPWKNVIPLKDELGEIIIKKGAPVVAGYDWFIPAMNFETGVAIAMVVIGGITIWGMEKLAEPSNQA